MRTAAFALTVAVLTVSCTSSVVGPDGSEARYEGVRGRLTGVVEAPLPDVERATRHAFAELDLVAGAETLESSAARLQARMATGTRVRVALHALERGRTLVTIRVGHIGDKAISMQLLRHIRHQL